MTARCVRVRQDDVFGERPVALDPQAHRVRAEVALPGHAVPAAAAGDVALAAHEVARVEVGHVAADLDDLADELMADDERRPNGLRGPAVPRFDVEVGAADPGLVDPDQDVIDAGDGLGDRLEPQARPGCGLDEREHRRSRGPARSSSARGSTLGLASSGPLSRPAWRRVRGWPSARPMAWAPRTGARDSSARRSGRRMP